MEGTECPLATYGYSRDKKKGKMQIVFGILTDKKGCPIAVEVFEGNKKDCQTLSEQIEKVRNRFGISQVIWVGDRGTITDANIVDELKGTTGLQWITALTKPQIRKLAFVTNIQLGLFDETNIVELKSDLYPGERLVVCRNPLVAAKNKKVREDLLKATEKELDKIVEATQREKRKLQGADKIGVRVGRYINKFKVAKLFEINITENSFSYDRKQEAIATEEALDGVYIIRTPVSDDILNTVETVKAYKGLSKVEQAFRCLKTIDLKVRPIYHYLDHRVKAHIFLCFLAYYVEWHMREALAPILFEEVDNDLINTSNLFQYKPSSEVKKKTGSKRTSDGLPVHSFSTLLSDLATINLNKISITLQGEKVSFEKITQPTVVQQKALDLLGVSLICTQ